MWDSPMVTWELFPSKVGITYTPLVTWELPSKVGIIYTPLVTWELVPCLVEISNTPLVT